MSAAAGCARSTGSFTPGRRSRRRLKTGAQRGRGTCRAERRNGFAGAPPITALELLVAGTAFWPYNHVRCMRVYVFSLIMAGCYYWAPAAYGGIPSHFSWVFSVDGDHPNEMKLQSFFESPLQVEFAKAAARGDTNRMKNLLAQGVSVNEKGRNGMNPLLWALVNRNYKGFKFLLGQGADPNALVEVKHPPRDSALTLAATLAESEYLQALLAAGAKVDLPLGKYGTTAIYEAAFYGRTNNIALMLKNGGDINHKVSNGETPLHSAVRQTNFEVALFLYRLGADPSIKDVWNMSPVDTIRKFKDQGYVSRKDKAAYKVLVEELQRDHKL